MKFTPITSVKLECVRKLGIRRIREEPEGVQNCFLFHPEVLATEGVCVE